MESGIEEETAPFAAAGDRLSRAALRRPAPAASAAASAVLVDAVTKRFDRGPVVREVSFSVPPGECFGLLGHNGAGKSTTLRMIYGFLRPSSGRVLVQGTDVVLDPRRARARLGVAPQDDLLDPDLDVRMNLVFHGRYCGFNEARTRERIREALAETGLEGLAHAPIAHLSAGQRRRLVIARALLSDPEIVILDEPTRGLDRESRRQLLERLQRLKARGVTLLVATHDLEDAQTLCDRGAVLAEGRLLALGPFAEVLGAYQELAPPPGGDSPAC